MKLREFFTTEASLALGKLGARTADDVAKAGDDIAKAGINTQSVGQKIGARSVAGVKAQAKEKEKETDQEVAIIFGRFNPPHEGHKEAWIKASESAIWYVGTNQSTIGPTDPLPFDVKVECMKAIWPNVAGHIVPEQGWWTLATHVYKKHGPVKLYVVTDKKDALVFVPGIQKENGKEGKHGYYNFKSIEWREADRISSATDLRAAVIEGNRKKFSQAAGVSSETPVMGKPFFDLVAKYLLPYKDQILASMQRKAAKAAKNEEAAGVGTITKQNTTVDVNASTPYKNLKAFGLVKESSSDLTTDEMIAILSGQKTQQQVLADRNKPATSGAIPMDRWTKRAKDMLSSGMNEQQVVQKLVKDGLALRLAQQAVQAAQINETFLQELENEMMAEASQAKLTKRQQTATRGINSFGDAERVNGDYTMYRLGMAAASTDGKITPNMDAKSWVGKTKLAFPYTQEEQDILNKAYKAVGASHKDLNNGDMRSKELDSTNKTSPVPKRKPNQYGI
jgi:hypothetical protein